jgi:NAD-specific glutamate dehydrogenase
VAWILLRDLVARDRLTFERSYHASLAHLRTVLPAVVDRGEARRIDEDRARWVERGLPSSVAETLAILPHLPSAVGAIDVTRTVEIDLDEAARAFYRLGARLRLGELRDAIDGLEAASEWERIAANGLMTDLRQAQRRLTVGWVRAMHEDPRLSLDTFLASIPKFLGRVDALWADLSVQGGFDLARAVVLGRVITRASLASRGRERDASEVGAVRHDRGDDRSTDAAG